MYHVNTMFYEAPDEFVYVFGSTVPALRGKDYGKSKMRYPDYVETESGLQYKVIYYKDLAIYAGAQYTLIANDRF